MASPLESSKALQSQTQGKSPTESGPERRLGARYELILGTEVEDVLSGARSSGQTTNISMHGCYIKTPDPRAAGTVIRVRLKNGSETFVSLGVVVYSHARQGMGVALRETEAAQQQILQKWIHQEGVPAAPEESQEKNLEPNTIPGTR